MIATYIGFSSVAIMCIMWLVLPFKSQDMIWAYGGEGLRTTISVENYWHKILEVGNSGLPFGEIVMFAVLGFAIWLYFRTKAGLAMKAVGANEKFARATGINIDRVRIKSVVLIKCSCSCRNYYLSTELWIYPALSCTFLHGFPCNSGNTYWGSFRK